MASNWDSPVVNLDDQRGSRTNSVMINDQAHAETFPCIIFQAVNFSLTGQSMVDRDGFGSSTLNRSSFLRVLGMA